MRPQKKIAENLKALDTVGADARALVLKNIERFSFVLCMRGRENFGAEVYAIWGKFIRESGRLNPGAQLKASVQVLAFALQATKKPVSALIVASFPIVYRQFPPSRDVEFGLISTFVSFAMPFYSDWDRAKSAERDLVMSFMDSNWPPGDLFQVAFAAGIEQKILKRVYQSNRGEKYLAQMLKDSDRFDVNLKRRLRELL